MDNFLHVATGVDVMSHLFSGKYPVGNELPGGRHSARGSWLDLKVPMYILSSYSRLRLFFRCPPCPSYFGFRLVPRLRPSSTMAPTPGSQTWSWRKYVSSTQRIRTRTWQHVARSSSPSCYRSCRCFYNPFCEGASHYPKDRSR